MTTKGILRLRRKGSDPFSSPRTYDQTLPSPAAASLVPVPPDVTVITSEPAAPTYLSALLPLAAHFDDLEYTVDAILHTSADGSSTALKVTDDAGRSRVAGPNMRDDDLVSGWLAHIWDAHLPLARVARLASEFEILPLLLDSLPDVVPVLSLEILFGLFTEPGQQVPADQGNHCTSGHGPVSLELSVKSRFPALRALRLGPGDVDAAEQTVLSAQDVAAFVNKLGAELPLDSIAICRGVVVDDPSGLECLALAVHLQAVPTYRAPHV
ncbi:hypothetical protein AURDEDRAFT_165969 [Auricularia subglabra TFB-10046 SS5]|nr:hypothetical protein AURDEDRAFT_165969 [Auricularia subglabra TFB-10046 SS5]